jgi:hypothetical protein
VDEPPDELHDLESTALDRGIQSGLVTRRDIGPTRLVLDSAWPELIDLRVEIADERVDGRLIVHPQAAYPERPGPELNPLLGRAAIGDDDAR